MERPLGKRPQDVCVKLDFEQLRPETCPIETLAVWGKQIRGGLVAHTSVTAVAVDSQGCNQERWSMQGSFVL